MIQFYAPQIDDLWFKQQMLADADTMSYNHAYGGTIAFPEERWADWYARWMLCNDGTRFYRYLRFEDRFLGEVAYHMDTEQNICLADILIYAPFRGKGYGREALTMLCTAAKENGIGALYDRIAIDNPSISLFLSCGFTEISRTEDSILVKIDLL